MQHFRRFVRSAGKLLHTRLPFPRFRFRYIMAAVSLLGLAFITTVFGAAVMYFDLLPAEFLRDAFTGYEAWRERGKPADSTVHPMSGDIGVLVDRSEKTFDGFTLVTTSQACRAKLLDMQGNVVHEWSMPFSKAWPNPTHLTHALPDEMIYWFRCHVYPNGDLLAIYQTDMDTPHGYGLAKLDKNSNLLWAYSSCVHHDLEVAEDGNIYALTHQTFTQKADGFPNVETPYLTDSLVVISPDGKELEKISILDAFRDSEYHLMMSALLTNIRHPSRNQHGSQSTLPHTPLHAMPPPMVQGHHANMPPESGDIMHANSVKVLRTDIASKFPLFKAGQVLISLRSLNTIAVLDRSTRSIVWAAQGLWAAQHDATFLENGNLLLYDNAGSIQGTRVLEYDPNTQAIRWTSTSDSKKDFFAVARGMKQRFPNGNTMILDPEAGRVFELSPTKEVVWEYGCPMDSKLALQGVGTRAIVCNAIRYTLDQLTFLKGTANVRP